VLWRREARIPDTPSAGTRTEAREQVGALPPSDVQNLDATGSREVAGAPPAESPKATPSSSTATIEDDPAPVRAATVAKSARTTGASPSRPQPEPVSVSPPVTAPIQPREPVRDEPAPAPRIHVEGIISRVSMQERLLVIDPDTHRTVRVVVSRRAAVHGLGVTALNQLKAGDRVLVRATRTSAAGDLEAEDVRVLLIGEPLEGEE
jgi:hypothetical protein